MPKTHRVDVEIKAYSTTASDPSDPPVQPGDTVDFYFSKPVGFPADTTLFVQFFERDPRRKKVNKNGCLNGANWLRGRGTTDVNGTDITGGRVGGTANGGYPYRIGYTDSNGVDEDLLDPEIVVEGNRPKKKKSGGSKKAKKAAKRPAGKKR